MIVGNPSQLNRASPDCQMLPILAIALVALVGCGERSEPSRGATQLPAPSLACVTSSESPDLGSLTSASRLCTSRFAGLRSAQRQSANSAADAPAATASDLLNWAEVHYSQYFPSRQADLTSGPYTYRYYPETGNYLGVADSNVYIFGPISGGELALVGPLSRFLCSIKADLCFGSSLRLVVSPDGSDSNEGTLVRPVRTIARALSMAEPGGTVYLRAGVYRESVNIPKSGSPGSPIVLRSLDGERGIISGADVVRGWAPYRGSIYVASFRQRVNQVFAGGRRLNLAQYPARGYLTMSADSLDNTGLVAAAADVASRDLAEAGVHVRAVPWRIEDSVVQRVTGDRVSFASPIEHKPKGGYGYYFDNKLWMLSEPGMWYHDAGAGLLYVWLEDSSDPNARLIEATVRDGVSAVGKDYVELSDVQIEKSSTTGLVIDQSRSFQIKNSSVVDSGDNAIVIEPRSTVLIEKCEFASIVRDGILVSSSDGVIISGNTFTDIGTIGPPVNSFAAIRSWGQHNVQILGNLITRTGYIGIRFYRDSIVRGNVVVGACKVLNDCGGIYAWDDGVDRQTPFNSEVSQNIVADVGGNSSGTAGAQQAGVGIYLDDYTNGIRVFENVVMGNATGMLIHGGRNHTIQKNTFYGNTESQIQLSEDFEAGTVVGNVIEGNILFPTTTGPALLIHNVFGSIDLGSMDRNRFGGLYTPTPIKHYYKDELPRSYTLESWRAASGRERSSEVVPGYSMRSFLVAEYNSDELLTNGAFDRGVGAWGGYSDDDATVLGQATDCRGLLSSPCLQFSASQANISLLISNPFSMERGRGYVVAFKILGIRGLSNIEGPTKVIVRRNGPTYDSLGLEEEFPLLNTWQDIQFFYTAAESGSRFARLDIQFPKGAEAFVDNVSIRSVSLSSLRSSANQQILLNSSATSQSMGCPSADSSSICAEYVDLDGSPMTFPIEVPAKSARIIVWKASPFRM